MAENLTKSEQSDRTQTDLIVAARHIFGEQGYEATSTQDIVGGLGVTRGALYYHFGSKAGLFRAVFEELRASQSQIILERMRTAEGDPWQRLFQASTRAFLEQAAEQETARILYIDGPAVLPLHVWHDNAPACATIQRNLEQLAASGFIEKQPFEVLARLLWGAYLEAALCVAYADDVNAAQQDMLRGLEQLIARLPSKPEV